MGIARQVRYADAAAAGGNLLQLRDWWSELLSFGHDFGYHVNAAKTWLVVKEELMFGFSSAWFWYSDYVR